ncbi:MAG: sulfite exporter TauE/SafE family protein [Burkholderiaceae bacterium]|nr:sulfite exporter TauE/SafE family protein [Burkholderiaceae bacterium]
MNASLTIAGLLMGLASSPHCALMCGAPCTGIARVCGGARPARALLAWHLGRAVAYTAAGALAAAAVGLLASWSAGSAFMRPLWTLLQAGVLVLGLALLVSGRTPRWVDAAAQNFTRTVRIDAPRRTRPARGLRFAALLGLVWVGLPCGVLYGALAVAALAAEPLQGAAVMAAFSSGSALGLAGVPLLVSRLAAMPQTMALRLAGATLATGSVWALWHGLEGASGAWCLPA